MLKHNSAIQYLHNNPSGDCESPKPSDPFAHATVQPCLFFICNFISYYSSVVTTTPLALSNINVLLHNTLFKVYTVYVAMAGMRDKQSRLPLWATLRRRDVISLYNQLNAGSELLMRL